MTKFYPSYLVGHNKDKNRAAIHKCLEIFRQSLRKVANDSKYLRLVRESDNPYDSDAVAVYMTDPEMRIGYIPSKHHWVTEALDEGTKIDVFFKDIRKEGFLRKRYYCDLSLLPRR